MTATLGAGGHALDEQDVRAFVRAQVAGIDLSGRTLCVVIPDGTRNCPLPLLLQAVEEGIGGRARSATAVVALGTHAPMTDDSIRALVGPLSMPTRNHTWWEDVTFTNVGRLSRPLVEELSGGRLHDAIDVRINRLVVESDVTLIVGPVLPHEVIGISGGNKYLFPGLSGPEMIDVTHWLGALITSSEIIGTRGITPVRALVDAAAELVLGERHALCVVVDHATGALESLAFGSPEGAWAAAADVAAATHVTYLERPVRRVLSVIPRRYPDLWTGAKGFYKVEPVVADGGEVVLFAPHITEVAAMHPRLLDIGYHCRDFFLAHWDHYATIPTGELAHATHLYGAGTYDLVTGEHQRVRVTLATGIPEAIARQVNLGYLAPEAVDPADWASDPDALVVPDAGEVLYRLL
jgi:nickel-dependent lactate racemase